MNWQDEMQEVQESLRIKVLSSPYTDVMELFIKETWVYNEIFLDKLDDKIADLLIQGNKEIKIIINL